MTLMPRKFLIITILSICISILMPSLTGCNKGETSNAPADSSVIKKIEEMQKRGTEYRNHNDFQAAILTHDSCILMAKEIKDTIQFVIALNNQGTNFRRLGALKEASDFHYRARQLCDLFSDTVSFLAKKNLARSLNGLGNILMTMKSNDAAEDVFRRALQVETSLESNTGRAINYANIGSIKDDKGDIDSARYYYTLSMKENRIAENATGISLCYSYLGKLDEKEHKLGSALSNFRQAFTVGVTTNDAWHWLTPCISLADIFMTQSQLDSASFYIDKGIEAATKMHSNEHIAHLYELRSHLNEKRGNTNAALHDLRISSAYNDSVMSEESMNHVHNLRANYEINRRTQEVHKAEEKAEFSAYVRNIVIVAAILIIALLVFIMLLLRRFYKLHAKTMKDREILYRNITHQLRTPLTVVLGMIEQLKEHIPANDKDGIQSIDAAHRQSKNLLVLVQELIKASKEGVVISDIADTHQPGATAPSDDEEIKGNDATDRLTAERLSAQLVSSTIENEDERGNSEGSNALGIGCESENNDILVVEDNNDVAMLLSTMLRKHGYNVRRAADGIEALEIMNDELPDLVITDIAMPRMDGLQLMRKIRADESMCHLPIIVVSARVEDHERLQGISSGAEVYLAKPFVSEELLLRVNKLLEQRNILRSYFSATDSEESCNAKMSDTERTFIEDLNKSIDGNMLLSDLTASFIAEQLCLSVSTLNRRTKNITGMSLAQYVRTRRLLKAEMLLKSSSKTIGEIETLCGFNTQGHFSRLFKQKTGLTPLEYRNKAN